MAAKGLACFIRGNGQMQLIASPFFFTEKDERDIAEGHQNRNEIFVGRLLKELEHIENEVVLSRLSCLANLIASKRLEIKLAIKINAGGKIQRGIYHEKIGIFKDNDGNRVAFTGSPNETLGGLVENFESIHIFTSWDESIHRTEIIQQDFDHLWNNTTSGLMVLPFPDAAKEGLIKHLRPDLGERDLEEIEHQASQSLQEIKTSCGDFDPWPHQKDAVEKWFKKGCRGILKMATGTGKTKTGLLGFQRATRDHDFLLLIIIAPYKHLVEQWKNECDEWRIENVPCSSDYPRWPEKLGNLRLSLISKRIKCASVICTYQTFSTSRFQQAIKAFNQTKMIIADEVHHFGTSSCRIPLEQYSLRLGLSATPERPYDDLGTAWIFENIGPIVFQFTIKDAIPTFLCPYDYFIHIVEMSREEQEEYQEVMENISKFCARGGSLAEEDPEANADLGPLLRKRQEIIGGAENKIPTLIKLLKEIMKNENLDFSLFYTNARILPQLLSELSNSMKLRISKFTFEESKEERQKILENLTNQRIHAIVAIKCLDEGLDIPVTRRAFILASSSNPMEYIQRRGRVLRKHQPSGKTHASIYDFFVVPPLNSPINEYDRRLVERELKRASEFADTARNPIFAEKILLKLKQRYNLLHL